MHKPKEQIRIAFILHSQPLDVPHSKLGQYELFATKISPFFTSGKKMTTLAVILNVSNIKILMSEFMPVQLLLFNSWIGTKTCLMLLNFQMPLDIKC